MDSSVELSLKEDGWFTPVVKKPSDNCDLRPEGQEGELSLLVIHNISLPPGQFGGGEIAAFFTNSLDCSRHPYFQSLKDLCVSAHLLIDRQGVVTQFVSLLDRAWHAGVSCFQGRERCNDFSIGIELEGTDTLPYTDAQYAALAQVTRCIMAAYPAISAECIVGHCDIAPGRKTDPGPAFDWPRLHYLITTQEA